MTLACERTRAVEVVEHVAIPMPDGVRLSARLWLPHEARIAPVPAVFEYIPYRKRDLVRARDERNHPVFAAAGYASLRVDMRGSGDSEGRMADMYAPDELADVRHVIDWIASQPWCDGGVGMIGTSWGGTAGLQASIDAPPALKTVIAVCATHDRFETDIHHMGGLVLTDTVEWGATLPAILALPPSRAALGDGWFDAWRERAADVSFPLEAWLREETRTAYWRYGSVVHYADRIGCPVLCIGGWSDRYSHSVLSLVEVNSDAVWGIVGPWGHHYPDVGAPEPAMAFQQEALAWFDHWLRPPTAQEAPPAPPWPKLRVWLRRFDPPQDVLDRRNGRWTAVDAPPTVLSRNETLYLSSGALSAERPSAPGVARVPFDLRVGQAAGDTGYFGRHGGLPLDQADDDQRSLCFDGSPLTTPLVVMGAPRLRLRFTTDQPLAQAAVRVVDVAPDGRGCLVVRALRNLALDDALENPVALTPGRVFEAVIDLPTTAYAFEPGHRIRVSVSASYWPMAVPAPYPTDIRLDEAGCVLILPAIDAADLSNPDETVVPAALPPRHNPTIESLESPAIRRSRMSRSTEPW
jgi:putative CocE/NonD family hydrolase